MEALHGTGMRVLKNIYSGLGSLLQKMLLLGYEIQKFHALVLIPKDTFTRCFPKTFLFIILQPCFIKGQMKQSKHSHLPMSVGEIFSVTMSPPKTITRCSDPRSLYSFP